VLAIVDLVEGLRGAFEPKAARHMRRSSRQP
jgi:hypothetical protein